MAFHMTRARRLLLSCSLTAVVVGVCSATSAYAQPSPSITVTILRPRDTNPIFGETLVVEATVTSTNQLSSVVATIGGRSTPLAFDFRWSATIPTADLPYGAMPLVVTATDTTGATAQADIALFHDNPPTLEYLSPVAHALARPDVRIHARCSSSEGPCHLSVVDLPAVTGTGEIDTVVSLADHEGQRVDLTIVATDGLGQERRASRPVWVESSRRLSLVATLAGPILDLDAARALVIDETVPRRVLLVDRLAGTGQPIFTEGARTIRNALLTPAGALVVSEASGVPTQLHEWFGGALTDLGELASPDSLRVAGHFAIFSTIDGPCCASQPLILRDLTARTNVTVSPAALNTLNDVTAAGQVVYAEPAGGGNYDLYRYEAGTITPLVAGTPLSEIYPRTDGTIAAYGVPTGTNRFDIGLWTPSGVESLAVGLSGGVGPGSNYDVVGGWTAFTRPGAGGSQQVWTRAPDSTLRALTSVGGTACIDGLTAQGSVMYRVANRRFLVHSTSNAPAVEIGSALGRVIWINDAWYVIVGPHILTPTSGTRYVLAEGATGSFFDLDVAILNPLDVPAPYRVFFYTDHGGVSATDRTLAAHARATIHVDDEPGLSATAVSTVVESTLGTPLVVERTMTWDASGYGGHSGSAVDGARMRWLFAEGSQGYFDSYFLLVNDGEAFAEVHLSFLTEQGPTVFRTLVVAPRSRVTVYAGGIPELVNRSFSTVVESSAPIVAERSVYFGTAPFWTGGHESAAVADAATQWYHAEGATGPIFDTFILLANPNAGPANVQVRFLTDTGVTVDLPLTLPGASRRTISAKTVAPALANASFATTVQSDLPIVSERSMYWSSPGVGGTWVEAHNSFGVTATSTKWGTSDGRVGGPRHYRPMCWSPTPPPPAPRICG